MKVDIETRNNLLHRREIRLIEFYDSNPGKSHALESVAKHFKIDEDLVVINKIVSHFGINKFIIDTFVYDDVQSKKRVEMRKVSRKERRKK